MASHGTAIALPRRPAARPRTGTGTGRHRRTLAVTGGFGATSPAHAPADLPRASADVPHAPVDLESMLVWFVVLLALGLLGVLASALA